VKKPHVACYCLDLAVEAFLLRSPEPSRAELLSGTGDADALPGGHAARNVTPFKFLGRAGAGLRFNVSLLLDTIHV
jgi:hypothetical protein